MPELFQYFKLCTSTFVCCCNIEPKNNKYSYEFVLEGKKVILFKCSNFVKLGYLHNLLNDKAITLSSNMKNKK